MIFLVQFRLKQQSYVFQRPQIALALFEKFACSDLSQIGLEIMQLPIHIVISRNRAITYTYCYCFSLRCDLGFVDVVIN